MVLFYILGTTLLISLFSLGGLVLLSKSREKLDKMVSLLVGLSTGVLLGGAFFHLIPEGAEFLDLEMVLTLTLLSFSLFFLVEKVLHWHHCHDGDCDTHTLGHMNILGDVLHNFVDGLIIAATFSADIRLGFISVLALASHEIPQGFSDFAILVYSGFERKKALAVNFAISLAAVVGGLVGYFFLSSAELAIGYLLPLAAGGFLYISTSDLIPELKKEENLKKSLTSFLLFAIGILFMYAIK